MRRLEPTTVTIGEATYYIFPFNAFYASNLSGEILALVSPIIASLMPLVKAGNGEDNMENILNKNVEDVLPLITQAFNSLSGDKVEILLKKLIINQKNVSVEYEDENGEKQKERLTYDLANELFCMDVFGMYQLAWEVIKLNYGNFFEKAPTQFGKASGILRIKK